MHGSFVVNGGNSRARTAAAATQKRLRVHAAAVALSSAGITVCCIDACVLAKKSLRACGTVSIDACACLRREQRSAPSHAEQCSTQGAVKASNPAHNAQRSPTDNVRRRAPSTPAAPRMMLNAAPRVMFDAGRRQGKQPRVPILLRRVTDLRASELLELLFRPQHRRLAARGLEGCQVTAPDRVAGSFRGDEEDGEAQPRRLLCTRSHPFSAKQSSEMRFISYSAGCARAPHTTQPWSCRLVQTIMTAWGTPLVAAPVAEADTASRLSQWLSAISNITVPLSAARALSATIRPPSSSIPTCDSCRCAYAVLASTALAFAATEPAALALPRLLLARVAAAL